MLGCEVHRVEVDAAPAIYTSTARAVHEYAHVSYKFSFAEITCLFATAATGNVMNERALVLPPS